MRQFVKLAVCALVFPVATVTAQTTDKDPRTEAKGHVGAFYFTPKVALKEFGVDGNVFNNGDQRSDFTLTVAPHLDVWVPFARRARISTGIGTDAVYYQTYSSERSINPQANIRGDLFLGRVSPFVEASYLNTRQRPNFEIDVRSRRQEHATGIGTSVRVSPKLSAEVAVRAVDVDFDADATFNDVNLRAVLNHRTQTTGVTVRHAVTALTTLALKTERGADRFDFSPVRDSDTLRVMPGVEFKANALISGSAYVGFRRFTPLSTELEKFSGVVAAAALNYTLSGNTRFTVTADRDLTYSYEPLQPYFMVNGYGFSVRRQIVGRFDAGAGVQRYQYSYSDLVLPGATNIALDRVDVTNTWTTSVGYRLGKGPRVGFGTVYRQRQSNSSQYRDYDGFRLATTIDYDF